MTLLFIYLLVQASTTTQPINYMPYIISAVISFIMWWIKSQMDRRYTEQNKQEERLTEAEKKIAANEKNDEKAEALLEQYQKNMDEKNKEFKRILLEIKSELAEIRKELAEKK